MQATLCAALAGTLGLAYWVQRIHAAALAFKLEPARDFANQVLAVDIRTPVGWKIVAGEDPGDAAVIATELHPRYGAARQLELRLRNIPPREQLPAPEDIAAEEARGRQSLFPPRNLDFLGTQGVFYQYPFAASEMTEDGKQTGYQPELLLVAVFPAQRVKATLLLVGASHFAAADVELLRAVAKSMKFDEPEHSAPELPSGAAEEVAPAREKTDHPD